MPLPDFKQALRRLRDIAGAVRSEAFSAPSSFRLPLMVVLLVLATVCATSVSFLFTVYDQQHLSKLRLDSRSVRIVQQALIDYESGARGYILTERLDYLQPYYSGLQTLGANQPAFDLLDASIADDGGGRGVFSATVTDLRAAITELIDSTSLGGGTAADLAADLDREKAIMDRLRGYIGAFLSEKTSQIDAFESHLAFLQRLALSLQVIGGAVTLVALVLAFGRIRREAVRRAEAVAEAVRSREQVEHLFAMTDILQSANGYADANGVLVATARRLLPGFGGALYIFNNSRDRLDLSIAWSSSDDEAPPAPQTIAPGDCWAMKRGKPHLNDVGADALRCDHAVSDQVTFELPMLARGEVYGLLQLRAEEQVDRRRLATSSHLANALADGMSLALAGIALRERLRNQALRDSLTGLYNRRFMEEVLERFTLQAERRNAPIAAIMIDLDHFKRLNDEHGHAIGDTVLRDVAASIVSALRASDVGCRYGGEELLVLLPDTDLAAATGKAEVLRSRIAEVSALHGIPVTASLGVAAIPDTATNAAELLKAADAALYEAKRQGRDQVAAAPRRHATQIDLVPGLQRSGTG